MSQIYCHSYLTFFLNLKQVIEYLSVFGKKSGSYRCSEKEFTVQNVQTQTFHWKNLKLLSPSGRNLHAHTTVEVGRAEISNHCKRYLF